MTLKGKSVAAEDLMKSMGYAPNAEFNQLNGHRRLLFYDQANGRQVDIFVGAFEMAHIVPITERIQLDRVTIPLAELLLTKLQVVHLNEKDQRDIIAILYDHPVGTSDENAINASLWPSSLSSTGASGAQRSSTSKELWWSFRGYGLGAPRNAARGRREAPGRSLEPH